MINLLLRCRFAIALVLAFEVGIWMTLELQHYLAKPHMLGSITVYSCPVPHITDRAIEQTRT